MYERIETYFSFSDPRGTIRGIINKGQWQEFNIITSEKDVVRGNHYHCHTTELFYILKGKILVTVQQVTIDGRFGEVKEEFIVSPRETFIVYPMVNHIFLVMQDAEWINALSHKIDASAPDILRIEKE